MNYKLHYDKLCNRAKNRKLTCYTEKHHIIPKCLGGTEKKTNIVELTAEEHFLAHQLLVKMHPEHTGLIWAAIKMTGDKSNKRLNNKLYGWLKRKNSLESRLRLEAMWKDPIYREKFIESTKSRWKDENFVKYMSRKGSEECKKRWKNPDFRERMLKINQEYWAKEENREKASKARRGKKNGSCGRKWYYHPKSLNSIKCLPEEKPAGYKKGRKPRPEYTKCIICEKDTGRKTSKYCDMHRRLKQIKQNKSLIRRRWKYSTMCEIDKRMKNGETGMDLAKEFDYKYRTMYHHLKQFRQQEEVPEW